MFVHNWRSKQGVLYCQNTTRPHGTAVNTISLTHFPALNYTEASSAGLLYRVAVKTHKCGQGTQLFISTAGDVWQSLWRCSHNSATAEWIEVDDFAERWPTRWEKCIKTGQQVTFSAVLHLLVQWEPQVPFTFLSHSRHISSFDLSVQPTLYGALQYKSEGRGFDSRWCHWNFSLT